MVKNCNKLVEQLVQSYRQPAIGKLGCYKQVKRRILAKSFLAVLPCRKRAVKRTMHSLRIFSTFKWKGFSSFPLQVQSITEI